MSEDRLWQITNEQVLLDWVAVQDYAPVIEDVLEWLPELAADPWEDAHPTPGHPLVVSRPSPVPGVVFTYLIAEQFHAIRLIEIEDLSTLGG